MEAFACALIDALGGTSNVARLMDAPVSTVQNMRVRRATASRLNHLLRIAQTEKPSLDVAALAAEHCVELSPISAAEHRSAGNAHDLTAAVTA